MFLDFDRLKRLCPSFCRAGKALVWVVALLLAPGMAAAMVVLDDAELAAVTGQALFKADYRAPSTSGVGRNFGYYRIAMDVEMAFNANIDKLQLGCGGFNDGITPGCDLDADFMRFMGPSRPGSTNPVAGAGLAGAPVLSEFRLVRPYVEFAVSNDGSANREIVGFRLGSELADGVISVGSFNPSCTNPDNPNCHTGFNFLSGDFNLRLEGTATAAVCGGAIVSGTCVGVPVPLDATIDEVVPIYGTRKRAPVLSAGATTSLLGINITLQALLKEDLRFLHNINLKETQDFGLSFQRERVAWPTFSPGGYLRPANTGWWFTAPNNVEVTGTEIDVGLLSVLDAVGGLLGVPVAIENRDAGQRPAKNCWGTALFC